MDELFDIVDDDDNIVGSSTRKEAHTKGLLHRSVMFFIFNKQGELFVNKRSKDKEFEGSSYSLVLGGHVTKGDGYEETAIREAKEEAGITSKPYFLATFKSRFKEKDQENVALYYFIIDHEPILEKSEIESGSFVDIEKIPQLLKAHKFIKETEILYQALMDNKEKIIDSAKHP